MLNKTLAIAVALIAITGCTFDDGYVDEEVDQSLAYRLGDREALSLESTSLVGVAAYDDDGNNLPCVQPTVGGGEALLRSTDSGLLLVEKMTIDLSDVVVEPGVVHSQPIHLTDIELRLGTQLVIEADWSADGRSATGTGRADLLMDWAVLDDDGDHLPLATQKLRQVEFAVTARLNEDGMITTEVISTVEGRIGGFANRIELSDFSMAVHASTDVPDVD
jgi:hypothetical protein